MIDFRRETLYFIVTDRFCDGDPTNNHGKGEGDFDPQRADWAKYWGGDLRGIVDKLDYIQSLGATSIWITPVFDQVDAIVDAGGTMMAAYHGYWAKDFKRVDDHLVDDPRHVRVFEHDDTVFDELVAGLHARGMKLVLDIVCNHSNPHVGASRGELFDDGKLVCRYDKDAGKWYRHEGGVEDWNDLKQVQTRDLCGLADFNEESHEYRVYIKGAMKRWLDKGVDAFRIDTVKHMPLWFWQEFSGDMLVHRPKLFMFGEWFQGGCYDAPSVEFASKAGMSILDFALRNAIVGALASRSERGLRDVAEVVEKDNLFRDPSELVTFVDNHDLPRFLSISNDPDRFRLALLLVMVSRGIPCIYYGNEQLLHCDTGGGNDPYNRPMMTSFESTPLGRDLARLAELRRASPAVQRGGMRTKWLDADKWVVSRSYLGSCVVIAVNRADEAAELAVENLDLADGSYEDVLGGPSIAVAAGRATVRLGPRSIVVYAHSAALPTGAMVADLQLYGLRTEPGEEVLVAGDAPELGGWDLRRAVPMEYVTQASWATTIAFDASTGRRIHYKFVVKKKDGYLREPGRGHHRHVPADGFAIWREDWRP